VVITQPGASTPQDEAGSFAQPGERAIEGAVMRTLQERGCRVSVDNVRHEVRRALERFDNVRIRQFIAIFVTRDVCRTLLERRDDA
jgi:hypothetical protein